MSRGWCTRCDQLVEITVTAQLVGLTGTARRWRLVVHVTPEAPVHDENGELRRVICDASGALI